MISAKFTFLISVQFAKNPSQSSPWFRCSQCDRFCSLLYNASVYISILLLQRTFPSTRWLEGHGIVRLPNADQKANGSGDRQEKHQCTQYKTIPEAAGTFVVLFVAMCEQVQAKATVSLSIPMCWSDLHNICSSFLFSYRLSNGFLSILRNLP